MKHTDAIPVCITGWDRATIITLGAAGCALSYDALQQMAVAIHIRGLLTYLFPFVIDGFIGYGVRAVLVMRSASLGARCYVWLLFATATAASIWANALHAVRLNNQPPSSGLRLGDVTVGVLSTLAPLALAGAVHLYILIARRSAQPGHSGTADTPAVRTERLATLQANRPGQSSADSQDTVLPVTGHQPTALAAGVTVRQPDTHPDTQASQSASAPEAEPDTAAPNEVPEDRGRGADFGGEPDARAGHFAADPTPKQDKVVPDTMAEADFTDAEMDSPAGGYAEELLPIARRAVTDAGKLTRKVVADAIRGQGHPLSNDKLTELMQQLRTEADNRSLRPAG